MLAIGPDELLSKVTRYLEEVVQVRLAMTPQLTGNRQSACQNMPACNFVVVSFVAAT